ncbi:ABC transporter permease [Bacillaceae bacterium Marseille-Q3522]|nr:ABC transporter permease [Bacillaceae bacterium Marseille-Q3522]
MFLSFIKKDILLLWRNPREFIILLLMPFVLISILGNALAGIFSSDTTPLQTTLAIVQLEDEDQTAAVIEELEAMQLPEAAINEVRNQTPFRLLKDQVDNDEELRDIVTIDLFDKPLSEKESQKYSAVLEVPENFTSQFLKMQLLDEGELPAAAMTVGDPSSLSASLIKDFMRTFQAEYSAQLILKNHNINNLSTNFQSLDVESVAPKNEINAVSYYTIGMCMMFVFYIATTLAELAEMQKDSHIFNRFLLANVSPFSLFGSLLVSAVLLTILQLTILFGLSALVFQVSFSDLIGFYVVSFAVSFMMGGFSVLLSAITYRFQSNQIVNLFSSILIPIISFSGGSMMPISQLGKFFEVLSNFSPVGAGITAYVKIMQGYTISDINGQLLTIIICGIITIIFALFIHPKRGVTV